MNTEEKDVIPQVITNNAGELPARATELHPKIPQKLGRMGEPRDLPKDQEGAKKKAMTSTQSGLLRVTLLLAVAGFASVFISPRHATKLLPTGEVLAKETVEGELLPVSIIPAFRVASVPMDLQAVSLLRAQYMLADESNEDEHNELQAVVDKVMVVPKEFPQSKPTARANA